MTTDTVANATKMVRLATTSFQAVAKWATSSKLTSEAVKDVGRVRLRLKLVNWRLSFTTYFQAVPRTLGQDLGRAKGCGGRRGGKRKWEIEGKGRGGDDRSYFSFLNLVPDREMKEPGNKVVLFSPRPFIPPRPQSHSHTSRVRWLEGRGGWGHDPQPGWIPLCSPVWSD